MMMRTNTLPNLRAQAIRRERKAWMAAGDLVARRKEHLTCFALAAAYPNPDDKKLVGKYVQRFYRLYPPYDRILNTAEGGFWGTNAVGRAERLMGIALAHAVAGEDFDAGL